MTLRDVVRITTLSKQWKNIWSLLSNLDLNWQVISGYNGSWREDGCEFYRQAYVKRVNKVLLKRFNREILSFRLSFSYTKKYASHVDYWISFVSKMRLESLTLQFVCGDHDDLLTQILISKHLKPGVLYTITCSFLSKFSCLKNLRLDACNLKLHTDFRFNKLVRLDLYYVFLEGNQLQWLLSNSSTIEWLRIRWCDLPKKLCIGDNLQRLSFLVIHHTYSQLELELNAKSLKFFDFRVMGGVKISFLSAAKLESCNLVIMDSNYEGIKHIFRQYATSIPSLETLILQGMYSLMHVLPAHPSTLFRRVVRLNLYFEANAEIDMLKNFPRLLNSFPQIQKLYLMVSDHFNRKIYEFPDVCLNTSLKEVELGNFRMEWIPCAIYILKCCVVLDRMLISCHTNTKKYSCDGEWERSGDCFSQQECAYIRFALQGNALSPSADLIIQ